MLGGSFPQLGGVGPMPQTKALLEEQGAMATQFFIHTPICCPSRSELLSGKYFHNIVATRGTKACMHANSDLVNNNTFAIPLKAAGYSVGMFGKYLNNIPNYVPPGFDAWMANGGGDYVAPSFATWGLDGLPGMPVSNGTGAHKIPGAYHGSVHNYSTSVIGNTSIAWIKSRVAAKKPFLAYIAPKAAHEPFNPAPWYVDHWDKSWPEHEPRPVNWNCTASARSVSHTRLEPQTSRPQAGLRLTRLSLTLDRATRAWCRVSR